MCCTTYAVSSTTTTTMSMDESFPYPSMPLVVQEEIIRRFGPSELINFSRTSYINYSRSRRIRAYPIKAMSIDLEAQEDGTIPLQILTYDKAEIKILDARTVDFGNKRIACSESFVLKGLNTSVVFTPEQLAQATTVINKVLPLLIETPSIQIYGLVPTDVANAVLAAAKYARSIDIADLRLSENVELQNFFPKFDNVQDINISNDHGLQFNSNVFPLLTANSKALRNVTVHAFFDADSIVAFLKAANFHPEGTVDFKIEKHGLWNHFANLRRKITAAKFEKALPKIGINGSFLRLN